MAKTVKLKIGNKQAKLFLENGTLDFKVKQQLHAQLYRAYPENAEIAEERFRAQKFLSQAQKTGEYEAIIKERDEVDAMSNAVSEKLHKFFVELNKNMETIGIAPHFTITIFGGITQVKK